MAKKKTPGAPAVRPPAPKKEDLNAVEFQCYVPADGKACEFASETLDELKAHLTEAHGWEGEQIRKLVGGMRMHLDGTDFHQTNYGYGLTDDEGNVGPDLVGKLVRRARAKNDPMRYR
jgi:hypothetical protein